MTSKLQVIRVAYVLLGALLVSICSITDVNAQDAEKYPTLSLVVEIDGKSIDGIQQLAAYFGKNGEIVDEKNLEEAFNHAVVPVQRQSRHKIKIFVKEKGVPRDVTLERGVFVYSTLNQLKLEAGMLIATSDAFSDVKIQGLISLFIYYYKDETMKKGPFGFNEFFFELVDH